MAPVVIRPYRLVGILALALVLGACRLPYVPGVTSPPPSAGATLRDATGRIVGSAVLLQESDGVRLLLDVKGLAPGIRAVHIHEVARCDRRRSGPPAAT